MKQQITDALKQITFKSYQLNLEAQATISLPSFKGSAFRGGFGYAFKKVVCAIKNVSCQECLLKTKCLYVKIFISPTPENAVVLKRNSNIPHPFIITATEEQKNIYKEKEIMNAGLTLIGQCRDYLPYFIYTFDQLGERGIGRGMGRFRLLSAAANLNGNNVEIYKNKILKDDSLSYSAVDLLENYKNPTDKITLEFKTPMKIKYDNHYVDRLEFHYLIRNLLRRLSSLSRFYCNAPLNIDFPAIIKEAEKVKIIKCSTQWVDLFVRETKSQDSKMTLGGVTGKVVYEGDIDTFLPVILLGEQLRAGKNISFGCGRYEVQL